MEVIQLRHLLRRPSRRSKSSYFSPELSHLVAAAAISAQTCCSSSSPSPREQQVGGAPGPQQPVEWLDYTKLKLTNGAA